MNKRQREKNQKNKLINTLMFIDNKKGATAHASKLKRMSRDLYKFHKKRGGKNEARRMLRGNGLI